MMLGKRKTISLIVVLAAWLGLFVPMKAGAATLTQGYHSSDSIAVGSVVSTTNNGALDVQTTTPATESLMVGVVTGTSAAIIDLQPKGTDVRVGVSGEVNVLVTDLDGAIKAGDHLIISPLAGIATKDTKDATVSKYVAIASQDFSSTSDGYKKIDVDATSGGKKQVGVGLIKAQLVLQNRPKDNTNGQNFFIVVASKIAGKQVKAVQLLAATAVFATTFSLAALLLNSSVRGSFISIGRNPLSKQTIVSNLFRILALGVVILVAGSAISYVILLI